MTKSAYDAIEIFFKKHTALLAVFNGIYKYITPIVFVSYPILLFVLLITDGISSPHFLKTLIIPFIAFVLVTIFRRLFNFQRPYEKIDFNPLIVKSKKGQSFPSRHSASVFIIAMAFLCTNIYLGVAYMLIGVIMCITRVIGGVHYIRDVTAGAIFSIIMGLLFWVL